MKFKVTKGDVTIETDAEDFVREFCGLPNAAGPDVYPQPEYNPDALVGNAPAPMQEFWRALRGTRRRG